MASVQICAFWEEFQIVNNAAYLGLFDVLFATLDISFKVDFVKPVMRSFLTVLLALQLITWFTLVRLVLLAICKTRPLILAGLVSFSIKIPIFATRTTIGKLTLANWAIIKTAQVVFPVTAKLTLVRVAPCSRVLSIVRPVAIVLSYWQISAFQSAVRFCLIAWLVSETILVIRLSAHCVIMGITLIVKMCVLSVALQLAFAPLVMYSKGQ